jgi:hypothetical protein
MIIVAATVAVVAGVFALRESQRTHQETGDVRAAHEVDAPTLVSQFLDDEQAARATYTAGHGQVILVRGRVRMVEAINEELVNVVLETGDASTSVICEFRASDVPASFMTGVEVAVKGVCKDLNKDELFGQTDVLLQRCVPAQ